MSRRAVVLSAVRTPVGRYGGGAGRRCAPTTWPRSRSRPPSIAPACPRTRSRTSGSAARTRPARTTATSRAWRCCSPGLPESVGGVTVNRLCASGLAAIVGACHAVIAGDGDLFVAGGVESMTRAPLVTREAGRGVPARRPHAVRHDARLAVPEPAARGDVPARGDGRDGRERRRALGGVARGPGRVRAALAAALGGRGRGRAGSTTSSCRSATSSRDEHPRPDTSRREARDAAARVPRRRHRHGRQLVGAQRRRGRARDRLRGEGARARHRAARRVRRLGGRRRRPARDGHRPGAGGAEAARAHRAVRRRPRPRRAERGVRVAVARGDPRARARRGEGERQRRRDRDRPPARDERRAARRHAAARAAPPRRPYGVATMCVGVGQGQAALFEGAA